TKIVSRYDDKIFNDKGLQSEINGLDKIIKLTNNTAIRVSSKFNKQDQEKINVVINIISDVNHYNERIQKMYNYGQRFKLKQRKLTNTQVQTLTTHWEEMSKLSKQICELIQNLVDNNMMVDNKLFNKILHASKLCDEQNTLARQSAFVPRQKINGDYVTYFDVLFAYENINTDFVNITIKIGILSN
ncbi:MAG: hypothetical protein IJU58_02385, partial [Clostridia bacterium]|nr:hypothetical protein [Clostridia bacterium]